VLDTGAAVTLIRHDHWNQQNTSKLKSWDGANLINANGSPITVHGIVTVVITFVDMDFPTQVVVADGLTAKAILGLDFLKANECVINIKMKLLMLTNWNVSLPLRRDDACTETDTGPSTAHVKIHYTQQIPAQSKVEVMAQVDDFISGGEWIIEPDSQKSLSVMVARSVVIPR